MMISRFLERTNGLKRNSLRSVPFPDVYVRCDGRGVTKINRHGGGTVNCQYKPPREFEGFYINPVEMTPSSASESTYKVVIESTHFRNVFIRLHSKGMNHFQGNGGGEVNCQFTPRNFERYILTQEINGGHSFRSVQFPECYIRLDGKKVTQQKGPDSNTVNCQWHGPSKSPGPVKI